MKKILGLDLGTNSIGWALINQDINSSVSKILGSGVRIIPMDQGIIGDFEKGNSVSQTAERTKYRSVRRLRERFLLRRERLNRVLNILGFLPTHYSASIDFTHSKGQFYDNKEQKIAYYKDESGNYQFLFKKSFLEFLTQFKLLNTEIKNIPFDWTIYYLRNKALSEKIDKAELSWIILHFNQKRGYNQLRSDEAELNENKNSEFYSLRVEDVIDTKEKNSKNQFLYKIILENGWEFIKPSNIPVDWKNKIKDFIITTEINDDGTIKLDKYGKEKRTFRAPAEDDWTLLKKKTEADLRNSRRTVGSYIYDSLLKNPGKRIKGELIRTIERDFYQDELNKILKKQSEFHSEFQDKKLYKTCCQELYPYNELHQNNIASRNLIYLLTDDIIFYQRPLKSKTSLISDCRFETRTFKNKDGIIQFKPLKSISKSHPLFQEFRLWQFIHNLQIYQREKIGTEKILVDVNVTNNLLQNETDISNLYCWLNDKKEVDQKTLLRYFKLKPDTHRWNYVEDKIYPCNKTRADILHRLSKIQNLTSDFLTKDVEEELWHILYSVTDKKEIVKAIATFAKRYNLGIEFIEQFKSFPPFQKEYGAYSSKAIKKLLPLMRVGIYWHATEIDESVKSRIYNILERLKSINYEENKIESIVDDDIPKPIIKSFMNCLNPFMGLNTYQATYATYNRHSEEGEIQKWLTSADIDIFLRETFKQHSLRNPIVEQVITETLRVVKDIWDHFGEGKPEFFDEIHIELGRELKNPAAIREKITKQNIKNENTNLRIRALLSEFATYSDIENVRPYSPNQMEILKIFEDGILNSTNEIPDDILTISNIAQPSKSELLRYRLWLDQKYRSPYTGEIIPLGKLFTSAYEIEHIIPQSRFFDDSLTNKIICESEVNKDKGNNLAYEYIKNNSEKIIELNFGNRVKIFSIDAYEIFVKDNFKNNKVKMKKLLMDDIPEGFIERQLNDTRYISKLIKNLLSNIVRLPNEKETTSKNVIASSGNITNILKQDWGLNDVWNELITPRFERLNTITNTNSFGTWTNKEGKRVFQTQVPIELQKGFSKKRIDHRHHALDAIIIASATRNHINYLNNQYANSENTRVDLRNLLCYKKYNVENKGNYRWLFLKPWDTFAESVRESLNSIVISFKQNKRVINKTTNYYKKWNHDLQTGLMKKTTVLQTKGDNWAIRKPLHKETVYGLISKRDIKIVTLSVAIDHWEMIVDKSLKKKIRNLLRENYDKPKIIKFFKSLDLKWNFKDISKIALYYFQNNLVANRVPVDEKFNTSMIKYITDTGIQKIMLNHLANYSKTVNGNIIEHPEIAFSADGIDLMNKNIKELNDGKTHKPILKVRTFEPKGNKFYVGTNGNKSSKYVEAAKGTNLFFAIYQFTNSKRYFETIPLHIVIEREKMGLYPVPEFHFDEKTMEESKLIFYLSPYDLVYLPTTLELDGARLIDLNNISKEQTDRIYKMVSVSESDCFFVQNSVANSIWNKREFTTSNKMEKSLDGIMIKSNCLKLEVDRLGNIKKISPTKI